MKSHFTHSLVACSTALVFLTPGVARAADSKIEIGTTMMSVHVGLGDDDTTVVGVPSGGFGLLNPGVFASLYVGPYVAIEPQIGLVWVSSNGDSDHLLNFSGQVDYFFLGGDTGSPYAFVAAGIIDTSGSGDNPKSIGGGAGYRVPIGDHLAFRFDGRYTHYTQDGGNSLSFALSIGGVFGSR